MTVIEFSKSDAAVAGSSFIFDVPLVDEDGAAVSDNAISAITGTLQDVGRNGTGQVINGRNNTSLLAANGGSLSGGTLSVTLGAADTVLVQGQGPRDYQMRLLLITVTYTNGVSVIPIAFYVCDPASALVMR